MKTLIIKFLTDIKLEKNEVFSAILHEKNFLQLIDVLNGPNARLISFEAIDKSNYLTDSELDVAEQNFKKFLQYIENPKCQKESCTVHFAVEPNYITTNLAVILQTKAARYIEELSFFNMLSLAWRLTDKTFEPLCDFLATNPMVSTLRLVSIPVTVSDINKLLITLEKNTRLSAFYLQLSGFLINNFENKQSIASLFMDYLTKDESNLQKINLNIRGIEVSEFLEKKEEYVVVKGAKNWRAEGDASDFKLIKINQAPEKLILKKKSEHHFYVFSDLKLKEKAEKKIHEMVHDRFFLLSKEFKLKEKSNSAQLIDKIRSLYKLAQQSNVRTQVTQNIPFFNLKEVTFYANQCIPINNLSPRSVIIA